MNIYTYGIYYYTYIYICIYIKGSINMSIAPSYFHGTMNISMDPLMFAWIYWHFDVPLGEFVPLAMPPGRVVGRRRERKKNKYIAKLGQSIE